MRRRRHLGIVLAVLAVGPIALWMNGPQSPAALFKARCAACHELPDLTGYSVEDMAPIVATMRTRNGAAEVIDDTEAEVITEYLEQWRRQADGAASTSQ